MLRIKLYDTTAQASQIPVYHATRLGLLQQHLVILILWSCDVSFPIHFNFITLLMDVFAANGTGKIHQIGAFIVQKGLICGITTAITLLHCFS